MDRSFAYRTLKFFWRTLRTFRLVHGKFIFILIWIELCFSKQARPARPFFQVANYQNFKNSQFLMIFKVFEGMFVWKCFVSRLFILKIFANFLVKWLLKMAAFCLSLWLFPFFIYLILFSYLFLFESRLLSCYKTLKHYDS